MVSDGDWNSEILTEEYNNTEALLVRKSALIHGFSDEGKLVAPVEFLVVGNLPACVAIFQVQALCVVVQESDRFRIQPRERNVEGQYEQL